MAKIIKMKDLLKESTWNNRKFGEPLPTMADYKKLKEDQGDIHTVVKINLKVNDFVKVEILNKRINNGDYQIKVIGKLLGRY